MGTSYFVLKHKLHAWSRIGGAVPVWSPIPTRMPTSTASRHIQFCDCIFVDVYNETPFCFSTPTFALAGLRSFSQQECLSALCRALL